MLEADRRTLQKARNNSTEITMRQDNRFPDQSSLLMKELVERKVIQNNVKNKLRKVLFAADKGKILRQNCSPRGSSFTKGFCPDKFSLTSFSVPRQTERALGRRLLQADRGGGRDLAQQCAEEPH